MRSFIAFAGLVALLAGLAVAAVQYFQLPQVLAVVALALAGLVVAVRAIVDALARFRGPSSSSPSSDPTADARAAARREARDRRKQLLRRFTTVVRALKAAQDPPRLRYRERGGAPWWLVVGPVGHGKSALLQAAPAARELAPPAEPDQPRFFMAADAVFVELPAQPTPPAAYAQAALLTALRRLRRTRPIVGVLVVHRADALLTDADITPVRRQLDTVVLALSAQVPVLLITSQLDRLAGFAELMTGVHPHTRPLGATLPPREGKLSVQSAAATSLTAPDGVVDWIRQRCHALVARADPGTPRQSRLYHFWQQFDRLAAQAAALAGQLAHTPLPGGDPLRVRGIWFTCARPDAAPPEDLWAAALARRLGGSLALEAHDPIDLRPAFVAGLFTDELPRDAQYAARLRRHVRRRFAAAACVALALAAAAAFTARGSTRAARANEALVQVTLTSAAAVQQRPRNQLPPLADLEALRQAVATWQTADVPGELGWGLFRGDQLGALAAGAYRRAVCDGVLRPLTERLAPGLRQFASRYTGASLPGRDEAEDTFDRLRAYLLLTDPHAIGEPDPWSERQHSWLRRQLEDAWTRADPTGEDPRRAAILGAHVALLGPPTPTSDGADACTRTGHVRAAERDLQAVAAVREILGRNPAEHDLVERLVERINRDTRLAPVSVRGLTTASHLRSDDDVDPAYTRGGWLAFHAALTQELAERSDQTWVLGQDLAADTRLARCTKLRDLYVARYIKAWDRFIRALRLDSPAGLPEAAAIYQELGDEVPLTHAFKAVAEHTQNLPPIPCSDDATTDGALALFRRLQTRAETPVQASDSDIVAAFFTKFVSFGAATAAAKGGALALDSYHKRLQELRSAVDKAIGNIEEYPALALALGDARDDIESTIQRGPHGAWKDPLARLLLPPIDGLAISVSDHENGELHREWCDTVVVPLTRAVADRYPFAPNAREDARLADLELLFHPQNGEIAKFRDKRLASHLAVAGNDVDARKLGNDARFHLGARAREFFDAAHKLGLLLYAGPTVGADLGLTMRCETTVQRVILTADDVVLPYDCSIDQAKQLHWPGKGDEHRAQVLAHGSTRTDQLTESGEFALLRLFERGQPRARPRQSSFDLTFVLARLGLSKLAVSVHPHESRGGNLFFGFGDTRFLGPFRAPGFTAPPHALFAEHSHTCPHVAAP